PKGRSTSRRKPAERPKKKAAGRTSKRAPGAAKDGLPSLLPIFTVWVVVAVVLGGLVYWGTSTRQTAGNISSTAGVGVRPSPGPSRPQPSKKEPEQAPAPPQSEPVEQVKESTETSESKPTSSRLNEENEAKQNIDGISDQSQSSSIASLKEVEKLASAAPVQKEISPPPKTELAPPLAEVAIVIDDFGRNLEIAKKFLNIPLPLTFSVLPFQAHSEEIVRLASSRGHEVILHVPMEPRGYPRIDPGPGALLVSMSPDKIQQALRTALDAYPRISGVNNHMGSRFTEKTDSMRLVLTELGRRDLYFLDSYTSDKSVGYSLARKLNVASRRRDIFLDHTHTEGYVRSQIRQLIRKAKIQGSALAIGHPHDCTYKVILEEAERFKREGIAVVPSGKLIQRAADYAKPTH
ncbi:MAG: divergent polysaccharide deacetylase family protein, partial [Desulforhabdus sp.]|nr:divergent polysaccharide deacetylase family protein [Desulforhabdus sp.]